MKSSYDYLQDIADMRRMMERSTRFLSLSGLSGILIGIYALAGTWAASSLMAYKPEGTTGSDVVSVLLLGLGILVLSAMTVAFLSARKARKEGETFWNPASMKLLMHLAVPILAGGILMLIMVRQEQTQLIAPLSLLFYGLALFSAGHFTYAELRSLGMMEMALGLLSAAFPQYAVWCWALGFGVLHILYGLYTHYRYER